MSSTPPFKEDAFISYRHADNRLRWIDKFHEGLEAMLAGMLAWEPKIWRDKRMPGNVYVAAHLQEKIKGTTVLISVLSPGYSESDWCRGELKEFCRLAHENGGLEVGGSLRIFKVLKTFIEPGQHPEEFDNVTGYEFYEIDQMTKRPHELDPEYEGPNRNPRFLAKLGDLAWDISRVLVAATPRPKIPTAVGKDVFARARLAGSGATIYLAETTSDLTKTRDSIKRELQDHGYSILPDKALPNVSPDYEEAVLDCIKRCKLSVHLIGENYGFIPERGRKRSAILLQNEIAAGYCKNGGSFSRLIWMPMELKPTEEEQEQFITELRTNAEYQQGAELLETSLAELKTIIQKKLAGDKGHKPSGTASSSVRKKIYLICDSRDVGGDNSDGILALNQSLIDKKYEVVLPLMEDQAEDSKAIERHKAKLLECDAILIYYGNANQSWLEQKQRDLEKITGLKRNADSDSVRPLRATLIYVAGPVTTHKRLFNSFDPPMKKNFEAFSSSDLEDFLKQIEGEAEGDDND